MTKAELQHAEAEKFDEICEFLARRCGYEADPDEISAERLLAITDEAEALVRAASDDKNLEPKGELQQLLAEHRELSQRLVAAPNDGTPMSKKRIRAARKELVRRGVLVDSGQHRRGQVVWMPNPDLTEEQVKALMDDDEWKP